MRKQTRFAAAKIYVSITYYTPCMVLLTVRTHGPVTQIVAIYRAHGRLATQWLITVRLTSRPNVSDDDEYTG